VATIAGLIAFGGHEAQLLGRDEPSHESHFFRTPNDLTIHDHEQVNCELMHTCVLGQTVN
jgi:hypothetical protein